MPDRRTRDLVPPQHVAQVMQQKATSSLHFGLVLGLSILDWQRSDVSGGPFGSPGFCRKTLRFFEGCFLTFFISATFVEAMSIVDCLRWQNFSYAQEDTWSTEAKSGVPRYDGEVSKLAEYQFRVRLRQAREKRR